MLINKKKHKCYLIVRQIQSCLLHFDLIVVQHGNNGSDDDSRQAHQFCRSSDGSRQQTITRFLVASCSLTIV